MKLTHTGINYTVDKFDDLPTSGEIGEIIQVTEEGRCGTFVYKGTGEDDGGTIKNGWHRVYDGAVNVKWFGAKGDGSQEDKIMLDCIKKFQKIHFPFGVYNLGSLQLSIELDNSEITCDNGTIIKSTNNDAIVVNKVSADVAIGNIANFPQYKTRRDWNDDDYGGLNSAWTFIHNVIIDGFIIETSGSCKFGITIFKGKNCTFKNLTIRNIDANLSNGIRVHFSKDMKILNCTIEESLKILYGIFAYWSYNTLMEDCVVYKVSSQAIENKHGVNSVVSRCRVYGDMTNPEYGIDFPYGSINCVAKDCVIDGANRGYSAGGGYEFDYTVDCKFINCYANCLNDPFLIERSYGTVIDQCTAIGSTFVSATTFKYAVGYEVTDGEPTWIKNSARYVYDGDYDVLETTDYGYKYYEYRPYPALQNASIINSNVKTIGSSTTFLHNKDVTYVGDTIDESSMLKKFTSVRTNDKFYNESFRSNIVITDGLNPITFDESYASSWKNITIQNIKINNANISKQSYGTFANSSGVFEKVTINGIVINGSVGTFINSYGLYDVFIFDTKINTDPEQSDTLYKISSCNNITIKEQYLYGTKSRLLQMRNNETGTAVNNGFKNINIENFYVDLKGENALTGSLFTTYLASSLDIGDVFIIMKNIHITNVGNPSIINNYMYHNSSLPANYTSAYNSGVIAENIKVENREIRRSIINSTPPDTISTKRYYVGETYVCYDDDPTTVGVQNAFYIATDDNTFTKV